MVISASETSVSTSLTLRDLKFDCYIDPSIAGFHCHTIIKTIQQNKVKNQRGKRRRTFKQSRKDSGLCDFSCGRYSKKCFTQIYKAMYEDAMFMSLWAAQIWRPEANKNRCHRVCYQKPVVVFWGLINFYMNTYSHTGTVRIAKFQQISHFFNLRYSILGRPFNIVSRKSLEIQPCFITRRKTLSNREFVKR